jgi:hypothetical protein
MHIPSLEHLRGCVIVKHHNKKVTALHLQTYDVDANRDLCCTRLLEVRRRPIVWPSRPDEVNFSIYLILPAALDPGVYSASNRNEYQKQKNNVSGE